MSHATCLNNHALVIVLADVANAGRNEILQYLATGGLYTRRQADRQGISYTLLHDTQDCMQWHGGGNWLSRAGQRLVRGNHGQRLGCSPSGGDEGAGQG